MNRNRILSLVMRNLWHVLFTSYHLALLLTKYKHKMYSFIIVIFSVIIYPTTASSFIRMECPGTICEGGCCPIASYTCCKNNLFCAKDAKFCVDYSRGKSSSTASTVSCYVYFKYYAALIIYIFLTISV